MNCKVCENTSTKNTKVSFFRFPKENSRCKDWVDRCNLQHLYEKYDTLRFYKSFRICSDHFDPKDIVFDGRKKRLLQTAVPHNIPTTKSSTENIKNRKHLNQEACKLQSGENLCRLCAEKNKCLVNIFGARGQLLDLENKLKYFPLKVNKYDTLPLGICNNCLLKVNEFCNFITDCIKAEEKLRTMLELQDCDRMYNVIKIEDTHKFVNFKSGTKTPNQHKILDEYNSDSVLSNCYVFNQAVQEDLSTFCTQYHDEPSSNCETFEKNDFICKKPSNKLNNSISYGIKEGLDVKNVNINNKNMNSNQSCCNKNFRDKSTTSENIIQYINGDQYFSFNDNYTCSVCLQVFPNLDILNSHTKMHFLQLHNNKEYICDKGDKTFLNGYPSNEQVQCQPKKLFHKCQTCDKQFHSYAFLKHSAINSKNINNDSFVRSTNNYLENKKTISEKCLEFCSSIRELNEKKESLMLQNKRTSGRSKIFENNVISHGLKFKRKCRFCDKLFKSRDMCLVHEKTHTECGKKFRSRPSLRQHRSVHSDKRLFTCQDCGNSFKRKDTLCNHLRIHTGERPFVCKVCGFAFKQRGDCQKHQKNHNQGSETCPVSKMEEKIKPENPGTNSITEVLNVDLQGQNEFLWNEVKCTLLPSSLTIPEVGMITVSLENIVTDQIICLDI